MKWSLFSNLVKTFASIFNFAGNSFVRISGIKKLAFCEKCKRKLFIAMENVGKRWLNIREVEIGD